MTDEARGTLEATGTGRRGPLVDRIGATTLKPAEPRRVAARLTEAIAAARADGAPELGDLLAARPEVRAFLEGVIGSSSYLGDLALADVRRLHAILEDDPLVRADRLTDDVVACEPTDEAGLMWVLRRAKADIALTLALADLAGTIDVMETTAALTRFADAALEAAARFALAEEAARGRFFPVDPARPTFRSGYVVLSMGKGGAYELNYSSDVDLIVLYDAETAPIADRDEAQTFFVRVTKKLVKLMAERTPAGYVFRVDLRLRPDPGATPIALSLTGALQYYESLGQNWERAAMIKARAVAGDVPAGERFLKELVPFVWRKYFDYAAIKDVHSIKRQIHAHRGHEEIAVAGHNVKLGSGGIREIEFFVQTQQLIAGGRNPHLRDRRTLVMLDRFHEAGWITREIRDDLIEAYRFLRNVEHRVQMVADEQTHQLPEDDAGLAVIGRMMGFRGRADFAKALLKRLTTVQRHYAALFENERELSSGSGGNLVFTGGEDDPGTVATLQAMGYADPSAVCEAVRAWHFGRYPSVRSAAARERLTEITPRLLSTLAATGEADTAFRAFDALVRRIPGGFQLFSLLQANPALLGLIAEVLGVAPRLADALVHRTHVLDAVLDPTVMGRLPTLAQLEERFATLVGEARGHEEVLDRARIFGQEQMFLIGVRVLTGSVAPSHAGVAFANLAETILRGLLAATRAEFARAHGVVPGGEVVVIALGKLGGREMTAASDLDLMVVYDAPEGVEASDGERPLAVGQYHQRLAQRLVTALSAPTAEGLLYEVDFRLRPSGDKGPLASRLSGFVDYQSSEAWTFEHMALTRARVVAGDPGLSARVDQAIREVLVRPRDAAKVRADAAEMRRAIATEKGTKDPFELKQVAGGLVDIEFIAQTGLLVASHAVPSMIAHSTAVAIQRLGDADVLSRADTDQLIRAHRLYTALSQILKLAQSGPFDPQTAPRRLVDLLIKVSGAPSLKVLEAELRETEKAVREIFVRFVGKV